MIRVSLLFICFSLGIISNNAFARVTHSPTNQTDPQESVWFKKDPTNQHAVQMQVYIFLTTTCQHCKKADHFFQKLEPKLPWISVHRYYLNTNKHALDKLNEFITTQKIQINPFAVPAIFFCNARWLGFDNENNTGKLLLKNLTDCHKQIIKTGKLSPRFIKALDQEGVSNWFERGIIGHPSMLLLIPTLAAMDAVMSCTLFAFLLLLSVLYLLPTHRSRLTLGSLFLLVIGVAHVLQQLQPSLFYQLVTKLQWPCLMVGLVLLVLTCQHYKNKCSFNTYSTKKTLGVVFIVALALLGVYSETRNCSPNFALVFQQYLSQQSFSPTQIIWQVLAYQLMYLSVVAVLLSIALWGYSRMVKYQAFIQKLACLIVLLSAVFLIVYPLVF